MSCMQEGDVLRTMRAVASFESASLASLALHPSALRSATILATTVLGGLMSMLPHLLCKISLGEVSAAEATTVCFHRWMRIVGNGIALATLSKSARTADAFFVLDIPVFLSLTNEVRVPWQLLLA